MKEAHPILAGHARFREPDPVSGHSDGCGPPGRHRRWQRRSGAHAGGRTVPGGRVRHGEIDAAAGRVLVDADEPYYHRLFEPSAQEAVVVSDRVWAADLGPRLAGADSKFLAYVAARMSATHGASEDAAAFPARHPIDLLPIP